MMLELLLGAMLAAFAVGYVMRPLFRGPLDGPGSPGEPDDGAPGANRAGAAAPE